MTSRQGVILMFSVSGRDVLIRLEQEFKHHIGVRTGISCDDQTFILAVECADTARSIWDVCVTVLTSDVDASFGRRISPPTHDRPAA